MRLTRLVLFATFVLLLGCGTDPEAFHVGCQHVSSMKVGPGLTPVIDWSPGCGVALLVVYEGVNPGLSENPWPTCPGTGLSPGGSVWGIFNPDTTGNILEPTVRYGVVPRGLVASQAAEQLIAGKDYLVSVGVQRFDGGPPISGCGAFRP
jgi:hypothetical protein